MVGFRRWFALAATASLAAGCTTAAPPPSVSPTAHVVSATTVTFQPLAPSPVTTPPATIVALQTNSPSPPPPSASDAVPDFWQATMQTQSSFTIVNPSTLICEADYKFILDFQLTAGITVAGVGDAVLIDVPSCPHQGGAVIASDISYSVSGQKTIDGFTLDVTPTGTIDPPGSIDLTGMGVSLSDGATSGTFTVMAPFTDASHTHAHADFPRTTTAGSGTYTTQNSLDIVRA